MSPADGETPVASRVQCISRPLTAGTGSLQRLEVFQGRHGSLHKTANINLKQAGKICDDGEHLLSVQHTKNK